MQSELALVGSKAAAETDALSQRESALQKQAQKLLGELEREKAHQLETLQEVGRALLLATLALAASAPFSPGGRVLPYPLPMC
jgi:hypothetical protein